MNPIRQYTAGDKTLLLQNIVIPEISIFCRVNPGNHQLIFKDNKSSDLFVRDRSAAFPLVCFEAIPHCHTRRMIFIKISCTDVQTAVPYLHVPNHMQLIGSITRLYEMKNCFFVGNSFVRRRSSRKILGCRFTGCKQQAQETDE